MADIKSDERPGGGRRVSKDRANRARGLETEPVEAARSDDRLLTYVELLFFAYRDFTSDPDTILHPLGFGRAHHRVLHFVRRYPGLRVADLLQILKITKQSLARILRDLLRNGYVERRTGASDRRERRLFATTAGADLADRLAKPQIDRLAAALCEIGEAQRQAVPDAVALRSGSPPSVSETHRDIARLFLYHMITPSERAGVDALMARRGERPEEAPAPPGRVARTSAVGMHENVAERSTACGEIASREGGSHDDGIESRQSRTTGRHRAARPDRR